MIQEEKDLLLRDLCARLPYGVKFATKYSHFKDTHELLVINKHSTIVETFKMLWWDIEDVKPYLRPLSSITEEEWRKCVNLGIGDEFEDSYGEHRHLLPSHRLYDWLNAHHFDYRGLIEKGFAIKVTEDYNPYKD